MKKIILLFVLCTFIEKTFAQKETFDLATFTPPKGWDKKEGKDAISFQNTMKKVTVIARSLCINQHQALPVQKKILIWHGPLW